MKTRKIGITLILVAIMVLLGTGNVQAALQANPNTHTKKKDTLANWVKNIRQMEAADGAMGLSETIGTDLVATSESNGIDVHCIKTTEYGAMAILSASGYGNPSNEAAITTTTGNNTGIMLSTTKWEWTAGVCNANQIGFSKKYNARYYDLYKENDASSAKAGDALGNSSVTNPGCAGWHRASNSIWFSWSYSALPRGNGGIFSFNGTSTAQAGEGLIDNKYWTRAAVVCGEGL